MKTIKTTLPLISSMFLIAAALMLMQPSNSEAGAKNEHHINIGIFQRFAPEKEFSFPSKISESDILNVLSVGSRYISLTHSATLRNGDVISIANDVLSKHDGELEDDGIDCQFSVTILEPDVKLAGICEIMARVNGHTEEHDIIIKPTVLHTGSDWTLLYLDKESGIAVYANSELSDK